MEHILLSYYFEVLRSKLIKKVFKILKSNELKIYLIKFFVKKDKLIIFAALNFHR